MIVPIIPMAHEYLITRPTGVPLDLPTMRDPSLLVYFRGESGGLVMGGYERNPAPWALDGIPADFNGKLLDEDWERFEQLMENALVRVPALADAEVVRLINGPEAFTPDGEFILGPTDVRGFWVAAGFCAHGLAGAGGMGKLVAEWIVDGHPGLDVWQMDSRRFGAHYPSRAYTLARTLEIYATYYDVKYPGHERAGRPAAAAVADVRRGCASWARPSARSPAGSAPTGSSRTPPRGRGAAAARLGGPALVAGHRRGAPRLPRGGGAVRRDVVRARSRSRARARRRSSSACAPTASRATSAQITYTQMLNPRGGIECDFTVTRLADDRFRIVTGTAFGQHDLAWIRAHAPDDGSVTVDDVTVALACLGAVGPGCARHPGARRRPTTSPSAYMHAAPITVGPVPCLALRVTYVGELGWELYCPTEFGLRLWDTLWEAGRPHGLVAGGYSAIDSLRLEKGYRVWGADITPDDTPYEAGARLRGQARQGRLHRARRAARRAGARAPPRLPRPRRPARGRARLGAGADRRRPRRPRHERRLRLHGRALDRLCLRAGRETPCPANASRSRSSVSGSEARSPPSRSSILPESGSGAEAR